MQDIQKNFKLVLICINEYLKHFISKKKNVENIMSYPLQLQDQHLQKVPINSPPLPSTPLSIQTHVYLVPFCICKNTPYKNWLLSDISSVYNTETPIMSRYYLQVQILSVKYRKVLTFLYRGHLMVLHPPNSSYSTVADCCIMSLAQVGTTFRGSSLLQVPWVAEVGRRWIYPLSWV